MITGLLLDEYAAHGRVRFGAFYLRRAARLLAALVLMLARPVCSSSGSATPRSCAMRSSPSSTWPGRSCSCSWRGDDVGAASAGLVVSLDHHPGGLRRALSWRPAVWTGVMSYGIYLWHWPLLIGVLDADHFHRSIVVSALVGLVLTPAVATLSYYCLERPVRAGVRRRLSRPHRSASPSAELDDRTTPAG